ncbi:hypothetical protein FRC00_011219 [Tulasnella sp. 408]|nr:hypothetical protein FRC00_011219 [Tulasnella sp. 408]
MGENNNGAVIHNVQLEKNHTFKAIPKPGAAPTSTPPPVHNASCDVCRKTIVGSRHKCLDCPDYDLCDKCVTTHRDKHPAEHEFYEFKEPGKIVIHNVTRPFPRHNHPRGHPFGHHHPHAGRGRSFGGRGGFAGRPSDRHEESTRGGAPDVTVPPVGTAMPLVPHNATCDLCDSKIHGNRYKCSMCPDYDVCESCFSIVAEQHPKHAFVRIRDPKDVMVRSHHYANRTVHHARCDSCGKQIVGARFKCTHRDCPDFDLCENCEALPIEAHPSSHALIKLKHPISFYEGLAGVLEYAKATKQKQAEMMDTARTQGASPEPSVSIWQPTVIRHVAETPVPTVITTQMPTPMPTVITPQMPTPVPRVVTPPMPSVVIIPKEQVEAPLPSASNPWVAEPIVLEGEGEMVQMPLPVRKPSPIVVPVPEGNLIELTRAMSIKTESTAPSIVSTPSTVKSVLEEEEEEEVAAAVVVEEKMEVSVPPTIDDSASPFNDAHAVQVKSPLEDDAASVVSAAPSVISLASSHSSAKSAPRPSATFVADLTIPDGHILPPGAFFVKTWQMLNNGEIPWRAGTRLAFTGGERFGTSSAQVESLLVAGLTPPGEMTEIRVEFRAPELPGRYVSNWRLQDEEGRLFGHRIWCDIEVVEPTEPVKNKAVEHAKELSSKSSEASLSSSSIIIMPTSAHSESAASAVASPIQEPLPTPTLSSFDGDASDIVSSVADDDVLSVVDSDFQWEETSRPQSPDQFVMVYETSNEGSDSDEN